MTSLGKVIDTIVESLPVPRTIFEGTWWLVGWLAGNSFGKSCDEDTMNWIEEKFDSGKRKYLVKFIAKGLHFIHHAYIGLLGVIYFGTAPIAQSIGLPIAIPQFPNAELFWLCLGLALEDIAYHTRASATDGHLSKMALALKTKTD